MKAEPRESDAPKRVSDLRERLTGITVHQYARDPAHEFLLIRHWLEFEILGRPLRNSAALNHSSVRFWRFVRLMRPQASGELARP